MTNKPKQVPNQNNHPQSTGLEIHFLTLSRCFLSVTVDGVTEHLTVIKQTPYQSTLGQEIEHSTNVM